MLLVLPHVGENEVVIDGGRALADRVEEPDKEAKLQEIVEWNKAEDEPGELIDNVEESKNDPVRQPLFVVIFFF